MPQGQQKKQYGEILFMQGPKVLLFIELQVGEDGKMIAQLLFNKLVLLYGKALAGKNIIYPEHGGYATECTTQSCSFFNKRILHIAANGLIGVAIGQVIEVAGQDDGVRTFVHLLPDPVCLVLPADEPPFEFTQNAF